MDATRKQAYDRGHTIFSPDGRLYQVEYAREAVERGAPSVGVRTGAGVVLAARKPVRSPLLEADTVEKIHRVDDGVAVATAGHAADARRLVDVAREASQRHRIRYGEPVGVDSLATAVADHVQEHTQSGGARPYGTALLFAGPAPGSSGAALYEVDPSGTPYGWCATAVGNEAGEIRRSLEERIAGGEGGDAAAAPTANRDVQWGIETALGALDDSDDDLDPDAIDVWTIGAETRSIDSLGRDAVADALAEAAS